MKKIILCVCLLLMAGSIFAANKHYQLVNCIGMESYKIGGKAWKILIDFNTEKVIIDGDIFTIQSTKSTDKVLALYTRDFGTTLGHYVYDAILFFKIDKTYALAQYNAATHELVSAIDLTCSKE